MSREITIEMLDEVKAKRACPDCWGTGEIYDCRCGERSQCVLCTHDCPRCDGSGRFYPLVARL